MMKINLDKNFILKNLGNDIDKHEKFRKFHLFFERFLKYTKYFFVGYIILFVVGIIFEIKELNVLNKYLFFIILFYIFVYLPIKYIDTYYLKRKIIEGFNKIIKPFMLKIVFKYLEKNKKKIDYKYNENKIFPFNEIKKMFPLKENIYSIYIKKDRNDTKIGKYGETLIFLTRFFPSFMSEMLVSSMFKDRKWFEYYTEDVIEGHYASIPFVFLDVSLYKNEIKKKEVEKKDNHPNSAFSFYGFVDGTGNFGIPTYQRIKTNKKVYYTLEKEKILDGLFYETKFNKNFEGRVLVVSEKEFSNSLGFSKLIDILETAGLKKTRLDSPEFEKYFRVYSSDEILARYILTHNLMEKLVQIKKEFNTDLIISFYKGNIAFYLDNIEIAQPNLEYSFYSSEGYEKNINIILNLFNIIEELNLDKQIWKNS